MYFALLIIAIVALLVLWAGIFRSVCTVLATLRKGIESLLENISHGLKKLAVFFIIQRRRVFAALQGESAGWVGWSVLGSVLYTLATIAFTAADAGLMALVMEQWGYGQAPAFLASNANLFVTVTVLASLTFWGLVLLDSIRVTRLAPWGELEAPWHSRIKRLALAAIALLLVMVLLIGLWRGIRTTPGFTLLRRQIDAGVPVIAQTILAVLVAAGAMLAGWSLAAFPVAAFGIMLGAAEWCVRLALFVCQFVITAVKWGEAILVAVLRIPAILGAMLFNWLVDLVGKRLHLKYIDLNDEDAFSLSHGIEPTNEGHAKEEVIMSSDSARTVTVLAYGREALALANRLRSATNQDRSTVQIRGVGGYDPDAAHDPPSLRFGHGVSDLSPSREEVAVAFRGANMPADAHTALSTLLADKAITLNLHLPDGVIVVVQDLHLNIEGALRELKRRLPGHHIFLVGLVPEAGGVNRSVSVLDHLHAERIVDGRIDIDPRSAFAGTNSAEVQDQFLAKLLSNLFAASEYSKNPHFTQFVTAMGDRAARNGTAFASLSISAGKQSGLWAGLQHLAPALPGRGAGDVSTDAVGQAKEATKSAIQQASARATEGEIDQDSPFFVVYSAPIGLDDPRFEDFVRPVRQWLASEFPQAVPIFSSAGGTPIDKTVRGYCLQVSAVRPLIEPPSTPPIGQGTEEVANQAGEDGGHGPRQEQPQPVFSPNGDERVAAGRP